MPGVNQDAELLKAQGNEFHRKGQYQAAYRKYTEAIDVDPTNAVYYSNRAASNLAMKGYLDAVNDAIKATMLESNYAKAWSRLATAYYNLAAYNKSIEAWNRALECLPSPESSTETEKNIRLEFMVGLTKSKNALDTIVVNEEKLVRYDAAGQEAPWQKAEKLESQLVAQQKISSGFVILMAHREFKSGVSTMKTLQKTTVGGNVQLKGKTGGLVDISNAVIRDDRAFYFDCPDWIEKFNEQVNLESHTHKAWSRGGPNTIKEEAPRRLQREGWDRLRPALSTTVRAWIMSGFLAKFTERYVTAIEYYTRAIEMLEWGVRTWENVPTTSRGVIFEKTFIRAVRRMKLAAMHSCVANKVQEVSITSNDMADFATEIIAETDANPPLTAADQPLDVASMASFWMYPKADASSILGWHYMQLGHASTNPGDAQEAYTRSADYYQQAAKNYPTDEENTLLFLKVALEAYWFSPKGKSLKEMMPLLGRINELLSDVMRIWKHSAMSPDRDAQLHLALQFAERCLDAVESGKITYNDVVKPREMEDTVKWKDNCVFV